MNQDSAAFEHLLMEMAGVLGVPYQDVHTTISDVALALNTARPSSGDADRDIVDLYVVFASKTIDAPTAKAYK